MILANEDKRLKYVSTYLHTVYFGDGYQEKPEPAAFDEDPCKLRRDVESLSIASLNKMSGYFSERTCCDSFDYPTSMRSPRTACDKGYRCDCLSNLVIGMEPPFIIVSESNHFYTPCCTLMHRKVKARQDNEVDVQSPTRRQQMYRNPGCFSIRIGFRQGRQNARSRNDSKAHFDSSQKCDRRA